MIDEMNENGGSMYENRLGGLGGWGGRCGGRWVFDS